MKVGDRDCVGDCVDDLVTESDKVRVTLDETVAVGEAVTEELAEDEGDKDAVSEADKLVESLVD